MKPLKNDTWIYRFTPARSNRSNKTEEPEPSKHNDTRVIKIINGELYGKD